MKNIWIDTDPGLDDTFAIMGLHQQQRQQRLKILGISSVHGNLPVEQTTNNALAIVEHLNSSVPVYQGAAKPLMQPVSDASEIHGKELGPFSVAPRTKVQEASYLAGLKASLEAHDHLEILAIGPLTNLAIFFTLYPHLLSRVKQLVIMGGGSYGNMSNFAEYNFFADPEAAKIVLEFPIPIVVSPLDVSDSYGYVDQDELTKYYRRPGLDPWVKPIFDFSLNVAKNQIENQVEGKKLARSQLQLPLYDPTAAMYLCHPELFEKEETYINLLLEQETRGMSVFSRGRLAKRLTTAGSTQKFVLSKIKNRADFIELFFMGLSCASGF